MTSGDSRDRLELVACRAIEMMGDLIASMERAAEQIANGRPFQEVDVSRYQLYMASEAGGGRGAIVCIWDIDECIDMICTTASKEGVPLEAMTHLDVKLPASEFSEDMASGGFDTWKGVSVDMCNDPFEKLLDLICDKLKERSLTMRCTDEEDVILYLPVQRNA